MRNRSEFTDLTELLDQDISSYEYFYALPKNIQDKIKKYDVRSFRELQELAEKIRNSPSLADQPSVPTAGWAGISYETDHLDQYGAYRG